MSQSYCIYWYNYNSMYYEERNVFTILNNNLKTNICGIGSAAHSPHNAMQTSTDILPIDIT